jgi:hypothetical protein
MASDRVQLEQALARELFATFSSTGNKVMTKERIKWIDKVYGANAHKRVIDYMKQIQNEEKIE